MLKNQTVRPSWTQERNERGLLVVCSQCYSLAVWYGANCTPYCATCWKRRNEDNQDSQKTRRNDDSAA